MAKREQEEAEVERLNMTPMIDVVFQLIVFFLVSMKFKSLDMKIDAFLPKDRGLAATMATLEEKPKIVAVLKRGKGESTTRVKVANQTLGDTTPAKANATWEALTKIAKDTLDRHLGAGGVREDVKGEVDAAHLVPTGDVIRAVDAFIAASIADVTFVGTPPPDSVLDRLQSGLK